MPVLRSSKQLGVLVVNSIVLTLIHIQELPEVRKSNFWKFLIKKQKGGRLNRLPLYFRCKTSTLGNILMFPKEISRSFLWKHGDGVADGRTIRYLISDIYLARHQICRIIAVFGQFSCFARVSILLTPYAPIRPEVRFSNFKKFPLETRKEWTQKHTLDFGENRWGEHV